MRARTRKGRESWSVVLSASAAISAAALFASCAHSDPITVGQTQSAASGAGGGGAGGADSAGGGHVTSAGGGGDGKCSADADCDESPAGKQCDTATGKCVECLPSNDLCPPGTFCDPTKSACSAGCDGEEDCATDANGKIHCDTAANACVDCLEDTHCALGSICVGSACVPGCSPTQGCPPDLTCCGSTCLNLATDVDHCGDCVTPCVAPQNAAVSCEAGACKMGACNVAWDNCDKYPENGCEWNVLQDGACLCEPGALTICYKGTVGTLGVGPCKAGITFCEPSGIAWGPCNGQVIPSSEICGNNIDEDCDNINDNVPDYDGDGWSTCDGDCCDIASGSCSNPWLINPGAYEVVGNGVNDDCDASTSDVAAPAACSTVQDFVGVTASDVAKAMDLCQFTTASPPLAQKKWGVVSTQQLLANGNVPGAAQLQDMQGFQTAVMTAYGTGGMIPKKGPTMAGISTGRMRDQGDIGYMDPNGGVEFGWDSTGPAAYLAPHGNLFPASAGCSGSCPAGEFANDAVNIRLKIRVPTNAKSFSYDFRFISAEYWAWTCTTFNDFYLALLLTGAPGIPTDKNISFDSKNNPVSVNNGFFDVCVAKGCYDCPAGSGALAGTGMELGNTGGATKWLTTDSPVLPGETIQLDLMIFDVTDNVLDSVALLDNFRWSSAPAVVETHE